MTSCIQREEEKKKLYFIVYVSPTISLIFFLFRSQLLARILMSNLHFFTILTFLFFAIQWGLFVHFLSNLTDASSFPSVRIAPPSVSILLISGFFFPFFDFFSSLVFCSYSFCCPPFKCQYHSGFHSQPCSKSSHLFLQLRYILMCLRPALISTHC